MSDLISRQAAIKAINSYFGFNVEEEYGSAVQEVINGLPSAQPEPRWIPVTERLPKYGEEVIVSICDESGDTKYNYTSYGWLTPGKEYWIVDNEINNYVVAWMPLPKPYERSEDA